MLNPPPRVSVVLCTFNGAAFIEEQMASILAQTVPLHEVVVCDDGSIDGTMALLERLAAAHPLIRLHRNGHNMGYNKNFEQALGRATGDVLAIADQDDVWHPQKLEMMLQQWPQGVPLIYCNSALFSGSPAAAKENTRMRRFAGTDARRLALYNTVSGHAMLLKRELLQLALPFNAQVYYDWWLAVVAACNGGVQYCPQVLVYQRWHGANATGKGWLTPAQRHAAEKNMVLRNLAQFGQAPGMNASDKQFFQTLHRLWQDAMAGNNRKALLLFLMRHRRTVYFSKMRKAAFFSHLKRSYRYAFR